MNPSDPSHDQQDDPLRTERDSHGLALGPVSRRTLKIALWVLPFVALANIAVLLWSLEGVDFSLALKQPEFLWLAMLLVFVPTLTNSLRLVLWSRFFELGLSFRRCVAVVTGTMIANSVTPSATGGMPIKLAFLVANGVSSRRAITLVTFQTAEDAAILSSMVALSLGLTGFALFDFLDSNPALASRIDTTLSSASEMVLWGLAGAAIFAIIVAAGLLGRRAREIAARASRAVREWAHGVWGDWARAVSGGKIVAAMNLMLAAVQWAVRFSIAGLILAAFGTEWRGALFWLLQYCIQAISSIVPTPGGAGGAEAAFLLLFAPFVDSGILVPAMSTWRLIFFFLPLTGAAIIFFVLNRKLRDRPSGDAGEEGAAHPAE